MNFQICLSLEYSSDICILYSPHSNSIWHLLRKILCFLPIPIPCASVVVF
ncbi:unnamed protein product [Larinioides sclopetarius]|uniref:Uncharacterized protein n=1 Tax=Larinioides sclopetarius TaxID=280406 RepID=A0AAV2BYK1_9ARAC